MSLKNGVRFRLLFDPSAKIEIAIAASALGAEIVKFHAVFDRRSFDQDASSSLESRDIKQLVQAVRNIRTCLEYPVKNSNNSVFSDLKSIFEKSLAVNKDLAPGHKLKFEDLEAKTKSLRYRGIPL